MTDLGFQPGFARDLDAIVRAFNAGLNFDPPAISVNEFRASLRRAGMAIADDDTIRLPDFTLPEVEEEDLEQYQPPEPPEEEA